jgi:hypothetical protein
MLPPIGNRGIGTGCGLLVTVFKYLKRYKEAEGLTVIGEYIR